jgi:hypothetical protein
MAIPAQAEAPSPARPSEAPLPPFVIQAPSSSTISTNGVQRVVPTLAAVSGGVCACNEAVAVQFQYGPTTAYGSVTPPYELPAASSPGRIEVGGLLTGLAAASSYHFRIMVTGASGTVYGGDVAFTTPPLDPVQAIFTQGRIGVTGGVAQAVAHCQGDPGDICRGSVQLSAGGEVIGASAFSVTLGDSLLVGQEVQNGPAPVTLTPAGMALLGRSRYTQAQAQVSVERGSSSTSSVLLYNQSQALPAALPARQTIAKAVAGSSCAHPFKLVVHRNGDDSTGDHRDISVLVSPPVGMEWTTAGPNYKRIVFCEAKGIDTNGKHWRVTGHPKGARHYFAKGATVLTATITARVK